MDSFNDIYSDKIFTALIENNGLVDKFATEENQPQPYGGLLLTYLTEEDGNIIGSVQLSRNLDEESPLWVELATYEDFEEAADLIAGTTVNYYSVYNIYVSEIHNLITYSYSTTTEVTNFIASMFEYETEVDITHTYNYYWNTVIETDNEISYYSYTDYPVYFYFYPTELIYNYYSYDVTTTYHYDVLNYYDSHYYYNIYTYSYYTQKITFNYVLDCHNYYDVVNYYNLYLYYDKHNYTYTYNYYYYYNLLDVYYYYETAYTIVYNTTYYYELNYSALAFQYKYVTYTYPVKYIYALSDWSDYHYANTDAHDATYMYYILNKYTYNTYAAALWYVYTAVYNVSVSISFDSHSGCVVDLTDYYSAFNYYYSYEYVWIDVSDDMGLPVTTSEFTVTTYYGDEPTAMIVTGTTADVTTMATWLYWDGSDDTADIYNVSSELVAVEPYSSTWSELDGEAEWVLNDTKSTVVSEWAELINTSTSEQIGTEILTKSELYFLYYNSTVSDLTIAEIDENTLVSTEKGEATLSKTTKTSEIFDYYSGPSWVTEFYVFSNTDISVTPQ